MNLSKHPPSEKSQQTLEVMKQAVTKALEKKKRLGQYAVIWEDGKPVLIGEDAPQPPSAQEDKTS
jgi:hypothetical protein